jgi:hypothetical protein
MGDGIMSYTLMQAQMVFVIPTESHEEGELD